jgi:hypothetical protein
MVRRRCAWCVAQRTSAFKKFKRLLSVKAMAYSRDKKYSNDKN